MKVALIQMNATSDKSRNIVRAVDLVKEAIACQSRFVLLPEVFNFRGVLTQSRDIQWIAEPIGGESLRPFMTLAKKHKVFILAGSVYEKVKGMKKVYNTSVLIDDHGKISTRYRKIHLFDAIIGKKVIKESKLFASGRKMAIGVVGKFRVGLSVCYDLRFPQLYKSYARQGAQVLCVPSAFTKATGQAHWEVLLRARAIENLCYVLAPNQVGKDGRGIVSYGHSMVVAPWGNILAKASGYQEEIIYARLDRVVLSRARKMLPQVRRNSKEPLMRDMTTVIM